MKTFALLTLLIILSLPLVAQDVQIPFDDAGKFLTLTHAQAHKYGLFLEHRNIIGVSLFQVSDESYVLEVVYVKDKKQFRERKTLTKEEYIEIRGRFSVLPMQSAKVDQLNEDGRQTFLYTTTGAGLFYTLQFTDAFNISGRQGVGLTMLIGGASFFGPFMATANSSVSMASARMTQYAVTRAIPQGLLLSTAIEGDKGWSYQTYASLSALLAGTQMLAGYNMAKHGNWNETQSETYAFYGDWAMITGFFAGVAIGGEKNARIGTGAAFASHIGGLVYGYHAAATNNRSVGDYRIMYTTSALGAYTGIALMDMLISEDEPRVKFGVAAGTSALGLWAGRTLTEEVSFSTKHANYVGLSTFGGWLTGVGAAYSIFGTYNDTPMAYNVCTSLGAIGGFAVMYYYLKDDVRARTADATLGRVRFEYNPIGLASAFTSKNHEKALPGSLFNLRIGLN